MKIVGTEKNALPISSVTLAKAAVAKGLNACPFRSPLAAHLTTRRGAPADGAQFSKDVSPSHAEGGLEEKFGENDKLTAYRPATSPNLVKRPKTIPGEPLDPKSSAELLNVVLP